MRSDRLPAIPDARPFRLLKPARPLKDPDDPLWTGVDYHGAGLRATVSQGRGHKPIRAHFPIGDDLRKTLRKIQDWRALAAATHRVERKARATQGALVLDVARYLELEEVQEMPVYKTGERARHLAFWVGALGPNRPRHEIDKNEINNIYRRIPKTPRRCPEFNDPKRRDAWLKNPRNKRPVSIDTANKMLRALSNVWKMLDRKGTYNPVREIEELEPEVRLVELDGDTLVGTGRSIPYADVERILAGMPDVGRGTAFGDREDFSATKIRLRVMAYCQITDQALAALRPGQINFTARCVALCKRGKGKGAPAIWSPVTAKALAALQDFHDHHLYTPDGGKPFASSAALRVWKGAAARVGLARRQGYRKYDLRHTVATALKRVTTDGEAIDYLMQHKIQGTTINYTADSVPERVRAAVDALDAYQRKF